jgi:hypothetical protein
MIVDIDLLREKGYRIEGDTEDSRKDHYVYLNDRLIGQTLGYEDEAFAWELAYRHCFKISNEPINVEARTKWIRSHFMKMLREFAEIRDILCDMNIFPLIQNHIEFPQEKSDKLKKFFRVK